MEVPRFARRSAATGAAMAVAAAATLLGGVLPVGGAEVRAADRRPPRPPVTLSATPEHVDMVGMPCTSPTTLTVGMTNPGDEAVFADMFIVADEPLETSRGLFSSYVPAGATVTAPVRVSVPRDTPPGDYEVTLDAGHRRLEVPVDVRARPVPGPGSNLLLGEQAFASSTHGSFHVCGAVDGNRNHDDWNSTDRSRTTGWNDATSGAFPDTYGVRFPTPTTVGRIDVITLDSTRYPANRYGLRDWDVQVQVDGQWQTVDQVRGNVTGTVSSTFAPVAAEAVQIVALASNDGAYARILELEAFAS